MTFEDDEGMVDELLSSSSSREGSPGMDLSETQTEVVKQSHKKDCTPQGVLHKIGALFTKLTFAAIKTEDVLPQLHFKTESDDVMGAGAVEIDESHSNLSSKQKAEDEEMEVEYMIIADKCVTALPSAITFQDDGERYTRRKSLPHQRTKRSRPSRTSALLQVSPPLIKRRRQISRIAKPRRKSRGVPGFK